MLTKLTNTVWITALAIILFGVYIGFPERYETFPKYEFYDYYESLECPNGSKPLYIISPDSPDSITGRDTYVITCLQVNTEWNKDVSLLAVVLFFIYLPIGVYLLIKH